MGDKLKIVNIGTDVGGKWGDGNDIPTACMVARNRYVVTQGHMISQFWHAYRHCVHHGIRQIIGLDWWQSTGHYYPSREHIRNITAEIKARLQRDGVSKDMACFENDNEPAKYNVPPDVHSWQANEIQDVLGNDYDCYAGSEEVSYRNFYNALNTIAKGYSFHLQNCALNKSATDASVNFMSSLAGNKGKLLTCSEGNFQDPSHLSTWHNVHYHVEACRRIGAKDYCVIFLELRNHTRYAWLAWRFNKARKRYYDSYINLINEEKAKTPEPIEEEIEDMKLYLLRRGVEGNFVQWLQEILDIEYGFENDFHDPYDGKFGPATEAQVREYQTTNGLQVDGIVGKETTTALINNAEKPSEWMNKLKIYMGFE